MVDEKEKKAARKTVLKAITARPWLLGLIISFVGVGLLMLIAAFILGKIDLTTFSTFAAGAATGEGGRQTFNRLAD